VDFLLYVVDGHDGIDEEDFALMKKYKELGIPMAVAYTKIDIMPKENIPLDMAKFADSLLDVDVFPLSARKGKNIRALKEFLIEKMPEGEKLFEEDIVSDKSEKFMISEIMREKILLKFDKEIPHGIAIVINEFFKNERGVYEINLDIVCERANHKAILIGKQGRAIKEVSAFARQDMEKFLDAKVFLTTYVKVKEDWRDRPNLLKEYGYEDLKNGN
jgi:GTP-binding protein Era